MVLDSKKMVYAYDIEIYPNLAYWFFQNVSDRNDTYGFTIFHSEKRMINEVEQLQTFLKQDGLALIGFNNISYDDPITDFVKHNYLKGRNTYELTRMLKQMSDEIINSENNRWKETSIDSLDLYRIWHFDNKNKRTSLKAVAAAIKYPNIKDLPIDPGKWLTYFEALEIIEYCKNDVDVTYELYVLTKSKIGLRIQIVNQYAINAMNMSDSSIGEYLMLTLLADEYNMNPYDLKRIRPKRIEPFQLADVILPSISFRREEFRRAIGHYKKTTYDPREYEEESEDKTAFKIQAEYLTFDFGLGGLHANKQRKVGKNKWKAIGETWHSNDDKQIILVDVSSYYPNLSIVNDFYPRHLGQKFCNVYKNIYETRKKAKYKGDFVVDQSFKLALNSCYGKSRNKYSFLYDPKFTMSITINGQLFLAMLCEELFDANIEIIQVNTDGICVYVEHDRVAKLQEICNEWMKLTKLSLDYDYFDSFFMRNVNNYLAKYSIEKHPEKFTKGDGLKYKGCFEIEKEYHKNPSMPIIPIAVREYLVNGIPIEQTIRTWNNPYDYLIIQRIKRDSQVYIHTTNGKKKRLRGRVHRYYVSERGVSLVKHYNDGRTENFEKGYYMTLMNDMRDVKSLKGINYRYYEREARKILDDVQPPKQQSLLWTW